MNERSDAILEKEQIYRGETEKVKQGCKQREDQLIL